MGQRGDPVAEQPRERALDECAVAWFAGAMLDKLRENAHKGHWEPCAPWWLLRRLEQETRELRRAFKRRPRDAAEIIREAADVANFALMLADNARAARAASRPEGPTPLACARLEGTTARRDEGQRPTVEGSA